MKIENDKHIDSDGKKIKDAQAIVTISESLKKAYIELKPPVNGGVSLTAEKLQDALAEAGVIFGIKGETIERLVYNPRYNKQIEVAEALLPVKGEPARFEYHFPCSSQKRPKELEDGSVDFKDLGILHNVREGDVLCTKIPPTKGEAGINVLGKEIPAERGADKKLPLGKNTKASENGLHVISQINGSADIIAHKIVVMDVYHVIGDVGYETGNIEFVGNVQITGNVPQGFSVRAEGNIDIKGYVEGGTVIAGGNVFIEQGVIGNSQSVIEAGGDLRCKYLQNAKVIAEMDFEAEYCINSNITSGANVRMLGKGSSIVASKVTTRHRIDCVNIGAKKTSVNTVLEVGADPVTYSRYLNIPREIKESQQHINKVTQLVQLFTQKEELGRLSEEGRREMLKLKISLDVLQKKMSKLITEQMEINQRMLTSGYGIVNATGTIYSGTLIVMGMEKKKLTINQKYSKFSRTEEGIVIGPAESF